MIYIVGLLILNFIITTAHCSEKQNKFRCTGYNPIEWNNRFETPEEQKNSARSFSDFENIGLSFLEMKTVALSNADTSREHLIHLRSLFHDEDAQIDSAEIDSIMAALYKLDESFESRKRSDHSYIEKNISFDLSLFSRDKSLSSSNFEKSTTENLTPNNASQSFNPSFCLSKEQQVKARAQLRASLMIAEEINSNIIKKAEAYL